MDVKGQNRVRKDSSGIGYFVSANALTGIITLMMVSLFSRIFSPALYGIYTVILSVITLVGSLGFSWMNHAITRFYIQYDSGDQSDLFLSTLISGWILSSFVILLIFLVLITLKSVLPLPEYQILLYGFLLSLSGSFNMINRTIQRTKQNGLSFLLIVVTAPLLRLIVTIITFYLFSFGIYSLLLGQLAGDLIFLFHVFRKKNRNIHPFQQILPHFRKLFSYGFPFMLSTLLYWIINSSDRYVLLFFSGEEQVGIYSMAYRLSSFVMAMFFTSIIYFAHPRIVNAWNESGKKAAEVKTRSFFTFFLMVLVPLAVGLILLKNRLFSSVIGEEYHDGITVFPLLILSAFLNGLSHYGHKSFELQCKSGKLMIIAVSAAVLNLILNVILIPSFGKMGAAAATLITFILYCLMVFSIGRSTFKADFETGTVIRILVSSVIMGGVLFLGDYFLPMSLFYLILLFFIGLSVYAALCGLFGFYKKIAAWLTD